MNIIGGTYTEICFEPIWEQVFGSGLRAVDLILNFDKDCKIEFITCADDEILAHLNYYANQYDNFKFSYEKVFKSPEFHYDHPLRRPTIYPRLDLYKNVEIELGTKSDNVLVYGLLEANVKVEGEKVVYDPQSPVNPLSFTSTGSAAKNLITIVNKSEAQIISGKENVNDIAEFFFKEEGCFALIIKMGAHGAQLFDSSTNPIRIPVYESDNVWTIGSGDIFSAMFAYHWFKGVGIYESAILASKATALYSNTKTFPTKDELKNFKLNELIIENNSGKQIYLAAPFFTFGDRWLVNQVWVIFKNLGVNIFSPFHDVGHGSAVDVVDKDLIGLDQSSVVFAIIDGLDSGTLFEVGYAKAKNKKVVVFVQNEGEESLKMLEGTDCIIEKDFTTAIYKTYWALEKK